MTNLIDVFLVLIAALLISIAQNPLNPFLDETVTVIKNAGQPDMELIIKDGETIETYKSSGEIGNGEGVKAGIAYKMRVNPDADLFLEHNDDAGYTNNVWETQLFKNGVLDGPHKQIWQNGQKHYEVESYSHNAKKIKLSISFINFTFFKFDYPLFYL